MDTERGRIAVKRQMKRPADPARLRAELLRGLAEVRIRIGLSQTEAAARMRTSQSSLSRLEAAGDVDPRISTLERFAHALNARIEWKIVPRYGGGRAWVRSP
jgi:transcriptional regulator with XRE-family HTH domain